MNEMTTRGSNPSSISPPVQIQQPRHVSTISSGTPPPNQQLYPGQSPGLVQGPAFNYIQTQYQQGEQLLPYQAYGSAPNDLRGPNTSAGRGGGPANMAQSGTYYHQPNQQMRPSQPPPNQHFNLVQTGQSSMRHPRPTHASSNQPVMFVPNNNMVIPTNMYQQAARMPMYPQGAPQYQPRYTQPSGLMYFNGVPTRPTMPMQTQGMGPPPQPREKRLLKIVDPNTGRNISDELINSSSQHAAEEKSEVEETPANDKGSEIKKNFTRQVVERMKAGDSTDMSHNVPLPSQEHAQMAYSPGPPQQTQATPPHTGAPGQGPMIRPPIRMASPAINLSVPPPTLPPNMYNRHGPPTQQTSLSSQAPPQPAMQTKVPPPTSVAPITRPVEPVVPPTSTCEQVPAADIVSPLQHPEAPQKIDIPAEESAAPSSASASDKPSAPVQEPPLPAPAQSSHDDASPSKELMIKTESLAPSAASLSPAVKGEPIADEQLSAEIVHSVESKPAKPAVAEKTLPDVSTETDASNSAKEESGASNQGNKDGKKGKKGKKDFTRKEGGGSDMDAFIDGSNTTTNNGNTKLEEVKQELDDPKQITNGESAANINQVESKSKLKKKKKKKSKKNAVTATKLKSDELEDAIENASTPHPVTKVCTLDASSPTGSHSSEGKDSGVDSEPGHPIIENTLQEVGAVPSTVSEEQSPPLKEDTSPLPAAVECIPEQAPDANVEPEKSAVRAEEFKNEPVEEQNGDLSKESLLGVKDSSAEELEEGEIAEENGSSNEDIESSKAEQFAKLKKSGGRVVYDRAYLMELRDCASSQTKPDGLPALEIILDQPDPYMTRPSGGPADFTPAFFQSAGTQRHAPPIGKSSSRGRPRPGDMPGTPRVIKSISMSNDVKLLHQSENPWKPAKKDEKEIKTLESEILFIMNRLTPTNFEKLAAEMKALNVKTYDDLKQMVNIFFDKVTMETKFVEAYALLCKVMSVLRVIPPTDGTVKENMATFRVVMLTKCQHEFEADKSVVFEDPSEKKKKLEADIPEGTAGRDAKIQQELYLMKLRRMKFYGNIRFIGELFKLGMLTENIMHDCIFRLLKAKDDDSLVSLCNLLTTVGRNLDTDKAKQRMDQYFLQMGKIADERKSRIKFTLRDVIDLRSNNWVPRKEATGPKKIDEVHKDWAQEQARNQYLASQPPPPRNDNQAGSRRGSRQRPDDNRGNNEDGWNTVSSKNVRMVIDVNKMKFSKSVVDDNIQLGPGGGAHKPMWSRGSHGGAQPQDDRPTLTPNRFSALGSEDSRKSFPRSPSRGEGAGRSLRQGPTAGHGRGKIMSRSSQEGDRRDAIANARSFMGGGRSQNSSRDNSWNRDERRQFMGPRGSYERDNPMTRSDSSAMRTEEFRAPAPPAVKQMNVTDIENKAKNILDEYLNIRDLGEAKLCVKELNGQNNLYMFVTASINNVLEKRDEPIRLTGNLIHELVSSNLINVDAYVKGLNGVLEYASDMVVDIPTLWNCLALVITPLLVGGSLPWAMLKRAFTPHLDNKDGAKLMSSVLSHCVEKQGEKEVCQQWQNSGLSWSTYLKPDDISSFIADKRLEFTMGGSSGSKDLLPDLESMIHGRASLSSISSYVEKSIPGGKSDSSFIRALTSSVVCSSITDKRVSEDVITNHKDLLRKYIGNDGGVQLQALYAIQSLMAKMEHPSGVLPKLFEVFYDENIIDEEVFYKWEKDTDPQEQEGRGTCLMQVRQFFVWLRENDEPEAES